MRVATTRNAPAQRDATKNLLPPVGSLREVAVTVATAVATQACREGLADIAEQEVAARVRETVWLPAYAPYERINDGSRGQAQ
jgi:malate dehydrogenase (oxaloacetate-decarboxylating)